MESSVPQLQCVPDDYLAMVCTDLPAVASGSVRCRRPGVRQQAALFMKSVESLRAQPDVALSAPMGPSIDISQDFMSPNPVMKSSWHQEAMS